MTEHPYRVLGPIVPPMLRRQRLLDEMKRPLLKPSPDHVSVVGPARYGKSVLLHHFTRNVGSLSKYYCAAVYVDLRHETPPSDVEFKRRLAEAVKRVLAPTRPSASEIIDLKYERLQECLELALASCV